MPEKFLLKDHLFNQTKILRLAGEIHHVHPSFRKNDFVQEVIKRFPELELKARITWIAECLKKYLPVDFKKAVAIIVKALPPPNNPEFTDNDFGDFIYAPYAEYVAKYGCTKEYLTLSLDTLREITQRFSAEDAIRYFINRFPRETLQTLLQWTNDPHYHVRRLCTEGTRPKLPWSQKLNIPVHAPLPILDKLFSDNTRYVTRSVANHVNDISKTDPELVIQTLEKWQHSGKQKPKEMEYIVRHALRTLIKQGNSKAMELLGLSPDHEVSISKLVVPKKVKMNTALEFSFSVQAEKDTRMIIDYILHFQNKLGKLAGKKIFKLTNLTFTDNKPVTISKRHMLREHMTTRTLYPGVHEVEIQINGKRMARKAFLLQTNH